MSNKWGGLSIVISVALVVYFSMHAFISGHVKDPYMDEIFHIPQAQQYCRGNFSSWDPMITTLPGLYYSALALLATILPLARPLGLAPSFSALCSVSVLRATNVVPAVACLLLFHRIAARLDPAPGGEVRARLKALALALFPLHWFFTFLFYTDVGSTAAVMATYLAALTRSYWLAALEPIACPFQCGVQFGAAAILFRQTNAVWVVFVTCAAAMDMLLPISPPPPPSLPSPPPSLPPGLPLPGADTPPAETLGFGQTLGPTASHSGPRVRRRAFARKTTGGNSGSNDDAGSRRTRGGGGGGVEAREARSGELGLPHDEGVVRCVALLVARAWHRKLQLLRAFGPLVAVVAAFAAFVVHNGGIVVGAKDAHQVAPHWMQPLYLAAFTVLALAPLHLAPARVCHVIGGALTCLRAAPVKSSLIAAAATSAAFVAVHYYSIAHPYLLADNRHYPFYIWRRVVGASPTSKYWLVPAYLYAMLSLHDALRRQQRPLWLLLFTLATMAVLVPAPLVEFRYFTIPFMLIFLHTPLASERWANAQLVCIIVGFSAVNAVTTYMFVFKPFKWPGEGGLQRFMW
eukprot:jgi/Mesen1/1660/ME000135S00650